MRSLKIVIVLVMVLITGSANAQFSFSMTITPPAWGPAGYSQVRYYYLPDVEAYYDVQNSMFIYYGGSGWVRRSSLPPRYRNYDLYHGYKVVMPDYHGNNPYVHFKQHKTKYGKGHYHGSPQKTNRDYQKGARYNNKPNGHYNGDGNRNGNDRDNGKGNGNRNGKGNDHKKGGNHDNGKNGKRDGKK